MQAPCGNILVFCRRSEPIVIGFEAVVHPALHPAGNAAAGIADFLGSRAHAFVYPRVYPHVGTAGGVADKVLIFVHHCAVGICNVDDDFTLGINIVNTGICIDIKTGHSV